MSATVDQRMAALARAKEVRSARSAILKPLRRGEAVIGDVDLDAPELASMRLLDFLGNLRYRQACAKPGDFKPPATRRAAQIVRQLGCNGNRRLKDLTERQKRALVLLVEAESVFQRRGR